MLPKTYFSIRWYLETNCSPFQLVSSGCLQSTLGLSRPLLRLIPRLVESALRRTSLHQRGQNWNACTHAELILVLILEPLMARLVFQVVRLLVELLLLKSLLLVKRLLLLLSLLLVNLV